ncbi:uncharacterized protein BDR25DRAFT_861 [Lindgomyces ingoldianus]|uniref:Uncharacterized protein n=1 Tax=Lindgomyces ingoldianus TaxID=673940 RepID=A0ACB6RDU4_9PLEO|nr:uncharacterized protein BDR25DRAFT_861 [Lindgomyces ingoldianus]KAF2477429.1 hypothetical protein BDR25DRAFT_861 [Lindgomyces ingoldianus]
MCGLLHSAYRWRMSKILAETPLPSDVAAASAFYYTLFLEAPNCTPPNDSPATPGPTTATPSTTSPLCRITAGRYSIHYWPMPTPTGTDFCNPSYKPSPLSPSIPGTPNTAVISGLTLTSPSIYHILQSVILETYTGTTSRLDDTTLTLATWNISTILPTLTVAQQEPQILSARETCSGREADYCSILFTPNFLINDISTVRAPAYTQNCGSDCISRDGGTIYQTSYKPTLAVPVGEVVRQNRMFSDCQWDMYELDEGGGYTKHVSSETAAIVFRDVGRTATATATRGVR